MSFEDDRLEAERKRLYRELSNTGDFRRGSIYKSYRSCGKPNCACAKADHPGHGPQYLLTRKENGKTITKNYNPGPVLERVEEELANHQKFRELVNDIVEVNEKICDLRETQLQSEAEATAKKGASKTSSKRKSPPK